MFDGRSLCATFLTFTILLFVFIIGQPAKAVETVDAPNASAIFEQARITWLGHGMAFSFSTPSNSKALQNKEEFIEFIKQYVSAVNRFCKSKGYPQPAFFGEDEAYREGIYDTRHKNEFMKRGKNEKSDIMQDGL